MRYWSKRNQFRMHLTLTGLITLQYWIRTFHLFPALPFLMTQTRSISAELHIEVCPFRIRTNFFQYLNIRVLDLALPRSRHYLLKYTFKYHGWSTEQDAFVHFFTYTGFKSFKLLCSLHDPSKCVMITCSSPFNECIDIERSIDQWKILPQWGKCKSEEKKKTIITKKKT